ncbi:MAG: cation transporter, partial [Candidatus Cloacimonadaceae bacterium]|nr:cation transporter [Candidatus Cloacimonadaceae bacterium]
MKTEKTIGISGMHCAACSARVEKSLLQLPGAISASVNLTLEEGTVVYDDKKLKQKQIEDTITKLGFGIKEQASLSEDEHILAMQSSLRKMQITWAITIIVTIFMIPHMIYGKMIVGH